VSTHLGLLGALACGSLLQALRALGLLTHTPLGLLPLTLLLLLQHPLRARIDGCCKTDAYRQPELCALGISHARCSASFQSRSCSCGSEGGLWRQADSRQAMLLQGRVWSALQGALAVLLPQRVAGSSRQAREHEAGLFFNKRSEARCI